MTREASARSRPSPASDLDAALPGLAEAIEPSAVARLFEQQWPGPGRAPTITGCAREHVRWSPQVQCVATFRLSLAGANGDTSTIGVVTVRPEGVTHRLFDADDHLAGLRDASDVTVVGPWLAEQTGRMTDPWTVTLVRYRPGKRCVLRYDSGGSSLFGKVLGGEGATVLAGVIPHLAAEHLVMPLVAFARPWQLVVQSDAGGPNLSPGGTAALHACGRLLARLHAGGGPGGPQRSLRSDTDRLLRYLPMVQHIDGSAEAFAGAVERLRGWAGPDGPAVPSHGAYRLNQVHLGPLGLVMVDLDSFGWAEPERDIANMLAYLRWRTIRDRGFPCSQSRDAFLAGYRSSATTPLDNDRIRAFEAASLLKIAPRRYRRLATDEWHLVPDLIKAAHLLLDRAPSS